MTIEELKEKDSFNETEFISKVDNTFIMLLSSIMNRNIDRVSHKISKNLYDKYKKYIDELIRKREIECFDEMNIAKTTIKEVEEDEDFYIVKVELISRYMDYFIEEDTQKFIRGINHRRIEKKNNLVFKKIKDSKELNSIRRCPGCGASVDINHTGICNYCGATFDYYKYDYILTELNT